MYKIQNSKLKIFFLILFSSFVFVQKSQAATLHVGSGQAYSTIASAIAASSGGDTIMIHSGTYAEYELKPKSGIDDAHHTVVQAAPGEIVTIEMANQRIFNIQSINYLTLSHLTIIGGNGTHTTAPVTIGYDFNSSYIVVDHCKIRATRANDNASAIGLIQGSHWTITNNEIIGNDYDGDSGALAISGIKADGRAHSNVIIANNWIHTATHGIAYKWGTNTDKNIVIEKNYFSDIGVRAIYADQGYLVIRNNVFNGCRVGIFFGDNDGAYFGGDYCSVDHNTIYGSTTHAIVLRYGSNVTLSNNILYNDSDIYNEGGVSYVDDHNYASDPSFTDPANENFNHSGASGYGADMSDIGIDGVQAGASGALSISSVSAASYTNGSTVTISGSGFDVKSPAAPNLWDTVENQYVGLSNEDTIPVGGSYPWEGNISSATKYDSVVNEQRGKSVANYHSTGGINALSTHYVPGATYLYISWWWKNDADVFVSDQLTCTFDDITDTIAVSNSYVEDDPVIFFAGGALPSNINPSNTYYIKNVTANSFQIYAPWTDKATFNLGSNGAGTNYVATPNHSSKFLRVSNYSDEVNKTFSWTQQQAYVFDNPNGFGNTWRINNPPINTWHFFEAIFDSVNHTYTLIVDGNTLYDTISWAGANIIFNDIWAIGWHTGGAYSPTLVKTWLDDIYIDNTSSRVVLGNASTYAASTHREMQIPTSWSENQIQFTLNQGSFGNTDEVYLYVVDADGNISSPKTINLSGPGSGETTLPLSPSGLNVS